jgi:hypothetical protein
MTVVFGRQICPQSLDGNRQIAGLTRRGANPLDGFASLGDRLRRMIQRAFKDLLGLGWALRCSARTA